MNRDFIVIVLTVLMGGVCGAGQESDLHSHEVLDVEDFVEGAEVQRRAFNRMTPPGFSFVQPMSPPIVPFDAANFSDDFLNNLLGEDLLGVAVYPLALELDSQTRETSIFNADGDLLATYFDENSTRNWHEDSDPARIILTVDLLPIEDIAPFVLAQERLMAAIRQEPEPVAMRAYPASAFRFSDMHLLANGTVRLSVTNGADVVEIFSCNDLLANSWVCQTDNLVLTNGSGMWEDPNPSPYRRFYAAVPFCDSDGDGLRDSEEIFIYGTDPEQEDSDGDGMLDGWEIAFGFAPLLPDGHVDSDGDGLTNWQEQQAGTDPHCADTDGDGIPDGNDPFPALKNCLIEKSLGTSLPVFHQKFQTGTGSPVYGGTVQVVPSGFVGNVVAITNITLQGVVDDCFKIGGVQFQWAQGAKSFSENITAAVSDKISGRFSIAVYDYISNQVTYNHVALISASYNTNFGANCAFQYLTELSLYFSTTQATFCWVSNGTFSARSRLFTDSYTGDRVEWSIATLAGSPASISTNGVVTYGAGGGRYRIRAAASELPTCWDTMTLIVPKVDIEQATAYVCKNCDCEESLNVTENSYSPGGIIWESEPPGISGRGEQITYRPNTLAPDTYTVTARSAAHPACSDVSTVHVVQVEMVTPAGDPVQEPVQSGDGQNEFTFSSDFPGILHLPLHAQVTPSSVVSHIASKIHFAVEPIAGTVMEWDVENPNGAATVDGDFLVASVTCTGLPPDNMSFGAKWAAVYCNEILQDDATFEVFFPRDSDNNPEHLQPNWFYYWRQVYANPDVQYVVGSGVGKTPAMADWTYSSVHSKTIIEIGNGHPSHFKSYEIGKDASGIDRFVMTIMHEEHHVEQIGLADKLLFVQGQDSFRNGWSWNQISHNHWEPGDDERWGVAYVDDDANHVKDDAAIFPPFEPGHGDDISLEHPAWPWWPKTWVLPTGIYAPLHPIEGDAVKVADGAMNEHDFAVSDWGDPGKNHKSILQWDD